MPFSLLITGVFWPFILAFHFFQLTSVNWTLSLLLLVVSLIDVFSVVFICSYLALFVISFLCAIWLSEYLSLLLLWSFLLKSFLFFIFFGFFIIIISSFSLLYSSHRWCRHLSLFPSAYIIGRSNSLYFYQMHEKLRFPPFRPVFTSGKRIDCKLLYVYIRLFFSA